MTYIDLNPVRAQMVANPDDFAFGSIYRIKESLERGEGDPTPSVGPLAELADGERGQAYLALTRHLAGLVHESDHPKQGIPRKHIPEFIQLWIGSKLLNETAQALSDKRLSRWSSRVYGSEAFIQQTLQPQNSGPTTNVRHRTIAKRAPLRRHADMADT